MTIDLIVEIMGYTALSMTAFGVLALTKITRDLWIAIRQERAQARAGQREFKLTATQV